jgi:hypothetical protein
MASSFLNNLKNNIPQGVKDRLTKNVKDGLNSAKEGMIKNVEDGLNSAKEGMIKNVKNSVLSGIKENSISTPLSTPSSTSSFSPEKLLTSSMPSFSSENQPPNDSSKTQVYSDEDLVKIKQIIYDVIKEKIPPRLIADKIGSFIGKMAMNENNIMGVKRTMMNVIFEDINILTRDKKVKYKFIIKLLDFRDIQKIIGGIKKDINFTETLKKKLLTQTEEATPIEEAIPIEAPPIEEETPIEEATTPIPDEKTTYDAQTYEAQPQTEEATPIQTDDEAPPRETTGGGSSNSETDVDKTKDLFYSKICRVLDSDISDNDILNLFLKYIEDFFQTETPEKTQIFQKMAKQIGVFIDQLFYSNEFKDPEFRKYFLFSLLKDNDIKQIIQTEIEKESDERVDAIQNVFFGKNTAVKIQKAFLEKIQEMEGNVERKGGKKEMKRQIKKTNKKKGYKRKTIKIRI